MKLEINKMRIDIHNTFLEGLTKLSKLVMGTSKDDIPDDGRINHIYMEISTKAAEIDNLVEELDKELLKLNKAETHEWDMFENRF